MTLAGMICGKDSSNFGDKFCRCVNYKVFSVPKALSIIPTDAHYYKSVEMFKSYNTCPQHVSVHAGTIIREQSCAWLKLQIWFFSVLVDMESTNAMAAYRPVVQAWLLVDWLVSR
jgi:hypothetical protein